MHTTYRGAEQLASVPRGLARYHRTFHLLGQAELRAEGSTGEGVVHCIAHHLEREQDGWWDRVLLIRYSDRYTSDSDSERRWRIADRLVHVDWVERRGAVAPTDPGVR